MSLVLEGNVATLGVPSLKQALEQRKFLKNEFN